MHHFKSFIALTLVLSVGAGISNKPALANCNSLSYWQTSDGRCFDLTAFTELGILQKEMSKPPVFNNGEVAVTNLRLIRNEIGVYVRGTVTNTSKNSVRVGMIDYELVNSNGIPIDDGTFAVSKTLTPGQTIAISDLISSSDLQGNSPSRLSVRPVKVW